MALNPAQYEAVRYTAGPLLVLAGAGSGKTRVITEKIAYLVRSGWPAMAIAAITFTNKAAREMRERATQLLPGRADDHAPWICTFHALGLKFLQIEHQAAGLRRGFSVFNAEDSAGLLADLAPAGSKRDALESLHNLISRAKNAGLAPPGALAAATTPREIQVAELYAAYQQRLTAFNAVDFDDLIRLPLDLLESTPALAEAWRQRLRYLLVDEYQDSNHAQYRLLKALAGPNGAFTAVGDDDQSIYSWRGAQPENLRELARDYPTLRVIKLEQNYRCSARILRAANAVIEKNSHLFPKKLWGEHSEGAPIRVLECRDDTAEAEKVAAEIAFQAASTQTAWSEFAVLYRGNHQARAVEKALRLVGIPYHLSGGQGFFDRTEVKDLLAWLRLLANPDDDAAFLRAVVAPKIEVGASTLERLGSLAAGAGISLLRTAGSAHAQRQLSARPAAALAAFADRIQRLSEVASHRGVAAVADALLAETGYDAHLRSNAVDKVMLERRRANVHEFLQWLKDNARTTADGITDLAAQLALLSHTDRDNPGNAVRLMTLHSAKGLEFRQVFLIGLEDGSLPHEAGVEEGRLEEERRLFYVGMTRAKEQLVLSFAASKNRYGESIDCAPSRFLAELPAADLRWQGRNPAADAADRGVRAQSHLERLAALLGQTPSSG